MVLAGAGSCSETGLEQGPPQDVCTPSWSGPDSDAQVGFAFSSSASAPVASAGQYCATSTASDGNRTDCGLSPRYGHISPVNFDVSNDMIANVEIVNTGQNAADISIGNSGYGDGWCTVGPPPNNQTCDLSSNSTTGDIQIWPDGGAANVPIGIEVLGVSYGPYPLQAPAQISSGALVSSTLAPGTSLRSGQAVKTGPYRVTMGSDGELAEYLQHGTAAYQVFGSGTTVAGSKAVVAKDGSVAVRSPKGRTLWTSRRRAASATGNLVLPSRAHRNNLWVSTGPVSGPFATATRAGTVTLGAGHGIPAGGHVAAGARRLTMQSDGDLVLADHGRTRWHAKTRGHPGAYLLVRPDGNAVLYSLHHRVLWSSRTGGHRGGRLELRAKDGRLVVSSKNGAEIWSKR